jgi:hypothetical protein
MRPCDKYPGGLVLRFLGDGANPIVLHQEEDEAIPGPLPYVDAMGKPVFTFTHAAFEQRGGRVYGTSPLDGVIQKQNQLNQLDAFILMIVNRMSNPLWLVPKGAEIEKFTGAAGTGREVEPADGGWECETRARGWSGAECERCFRSASSICGHRRRAGHL